MGSDRQSDRKAAMLVQGLQAGVHQRDEVRRQHDRRLRFVKFVEAINSNEEKEYRRRTTIEINQKAYIEQLEALFQRAQES